MPNFATDSAAGIAAPDRGFKQAIGDAAYSQAGLGPGDVDVALERSLCATKPREQRAPWHAG